MGHAGRNEAARETSNERNPMNQNSHQPVNPREDAQSTRTGVAHTVTSVVLFAVAASLFVHVLLTYIAATTRFGDPQPEQRVREISVELAEVVDDELMPASDPELSPVEPDIEPIPEPEIVSERLVDVPVPESELASLEVSDLGALGSAGDGASDIATATLSSASASFFGVEARGSRFVYIVDTSGSMRSNRLDALKIALTDSINALVEQARFAVVQYNSQAESLNGNDWWTGEGDDKADALEAIARLEAGQATEPIPAFRIAFEFAPPTDAIYFMTDGRFSPSTENEILGSIRRLMRQSNTRPTIHTISFVDKDAENLLRRIARMTGGSYTHVPGLGP